MTSKNHRDEFFATIRRALGRTTGGHQPVQEGDSALARDARAVNEAAHAVRRQAQAEADTLMVQLEAAAAQAGWKVARVATLEHAARYVQKLARDVEASSVVRSAHPVLEGLRLEQALEGSGIEVTLMSLGGAAGVTDADDKRRLLREKAIRADIGVTGVDYAIAETGSCVLLARKGVSRLVALLPPVHVAVVERGHVLPGLDELFTLRRQDFLQGDPGSYMNIITGPSRSADIEYTLVTGVHGPGDVHMLLVG